MRIATICVGWAVAMILLGLSAWEASGGEPRDSGFYSPDDPRTASWLHRVATGQAGFYGHCDDDHAKRHSPYIEWHCRPSSFNAWPPRLTLSTLGADLTRKAQRHEWGQGACAPDRPCPSDSPRPISLLRLPPELKLPALR